MGSENCFWYLCCSFLTVIFCSDMVHKKYRHDKILLSCQNTFPYISLHFVKRISHAFIPEFSMRQIVFIDACI